MIIYLIRNRINGKGYVGQTVRPFERRWIEHCTTKDNRAISRAIRKYGADNFETCVLDEVDSLEELNRLEAEHIAKQNTLSPNGYNLTTGGNQISFAKEVRDRMSARMMGNTFSRGLVHSSESRARMSTTRKQKGISPEWREKMNAALRTEEVRRKRSIQATGIKFSEERRARIAAALKGKKHPDERRKNQSIAQQRRRARESQAQCNQ